MGTDVSDRPPICRDPYPGSLERLKWAWVRHVTDQDVPPKAWVKLYCPETGRVIATEHTEPVDIEHDVEGDRDFGGDVGIWTYECIDCGNEHRWLWGPPAPIRVE